MSGIIGPVTPARIAFALGTIGVGALVGGAIAEHRDQDVGRGALYGGLAATAGLALLYGGAHAWNRITGAGSGASAGASQLGTTLGRFTTPATHAGTSVMPAATTISHLPPPALLFHRATPALRMPVPAIASTPMLPVSTIQSSGGTFLDALRSLLPRV